MKTPQRTEQKFTLIKNAAYVDRTIKEQNQAIMSSLTEMANETNATVAQLTESITHVLAGLASKASAGEPIKLMHVNSVGAFLAGVEAIAAALPASTDPIKRQNTLRILATSGIGADGKVNDQTFPIVNLGARKEDRHRAMSKIVSDYMASQLRGEPQGEVLARLARKLQSDIDRAMRSALPT